MARFLLSQYATKKNNNPNNRNKKWDKNKKDDNTKSEDMSNNNVSTVGAHVGDATSEKDKTGAPSNLSSISVHVSGVTKTVVKQMQYT